ncbi:molybdate ABC transporter substrate-binding protein [Aquimarina mytili]|uniref:molybdate ABC transporter substrate-binding protein n=1 Tax=Aquimarina mytili TaxID=874423 RepID=UPI00293D5542|nr:molybdate ABC transporter substrate-binding protein [Aquimarina mytili]
MKKANLLILISIILSTACKPQHDYKLNIAVAANMQFAMKELSKAFTNQTGIACDLIIGSSGKLTAQIKEGAPFDIFVSADMKYPNDLFKSGHTSTVPKIYAYGKLVLWSMIDDTEPSIDILNTSEIKHIAIANPKTAPYGIAAIQVLNQHGIYESIKGKLVFGESISQTNQFITSKSAEIGFTSKSIVLSPQIKGKGNWVDIPNTDYSAIRQAVVILKNKNNLQDYAQAFHDFLFTDNAKNILENYGYSVKRQ